jgi:hypothetical protein
MITVHSTNPTAILPDAFKDRVLDFYDRVLISCIGGTFADSSAEDYSTPVLLEECFLAARLATERRFGVKLDLPADGTTGENTTGRTTWRTTDRRLPYGGAVPVPVQPAGDVARVIELLELIAQKLGVQFAL